MAVPTPYDSNAALLADVCVDMGIMCKWGEGLTNDQQNIVGGKGILALDSSTIASLNVILASLRYPCKPEELKVEAWFFYRGINQLKPKQSEYYPILAPVTPAFDEFRRRPINATTLASFATFFDYMVQMYGSFYAPFNHLDAQTLLSWMSGSFDDVIGTSFEEQVYYFLGLVGAVALVIGVTDAVLAARCTSMLTKWGQSGTELPAKLVKSTKWIWKWQAASEFAGSTVAFAVPVAALIANQKYDDSIWGSGRGGDFVGLLSEEVPGSNGFRFSMMKLSEQDHYFTNAVAKMVLDVGAKNRTRLADQRNPGWFADAVAYWDKKLKELAGLISDAIAKATAPIMGILTTALTAFTMWKVVKVVVALSKKDRQPKRRG